MTVDKVSQSKGPTSRPTRSSPASKSSPTPAPTKKTSRASTPAANEKVTLSRESGEGDAPTRVNFDAWDDEQQTQKSPEAERFHENLAENPEAQAKYDALTPAEQKTYQDLSLQNMPPADSSVLDITSEAAQQDLTNLLQSGRLQKKGEDGRSTLDHLGRLNTEPLREGIDRQDLLRSTLEDLSYAAAEARGGVSTREEVVRSLAHSDPSAYARTVADLASPDATSQLHGRELKSQEPSNRSEELLRDSLPDGLANEVIRQQELQENPELRERLEKLSPEQRDKFDTLYSIGLNEEGTETTLSPAQRDKQWSAQTGRKALTKLLSEGKLGAKDSEGGTLLDNLAGIAHQTPAQEDGTSLDSHSIYNQTARQVADPGSIQQGSKGTCSVTTLEHLLATEQPSEYARLVKGLTGENGSVELRDGSPLERDDGVLSGDRSMRSDVSRILQTSFMEKANGSLDYRNDEDHHTNWRKELGAAFGADTRRSGLHLEKLGELSGSVFGTEFRTHPGGLRGGSDSELVSLIQDTMGSGRMAGVSLRWSREDEGKYGYHALSVSGIDDEFVYMRNPHGPGSTSNSDSSKGVVYQRISDDAAELSGVRNASHQGTIRMTRSDFLANLSTLMIEN